MTHRSLSHLAMGKRLLVCNTSDVVSPSEIYIGICRNFHRIRRYILHLLPHVRPMRQSPLSMDFANNCPTFLMSRSIHTSILRSSTAKDARCESWLLTAHPLPSHCPAPAYYITARAQSRGLPPTGWAGGGPFHSSSIHTATCIKRDVWREI